MTPRELELQIQQLLDGKLPVAEADQLVELLVNDPEALELYRQYAILDSSLARLLQGKMSLTDEDSIAAIAEKRSRFRSLKFTWIAAAAILALSLITLRFIFIAEPPPVLTLRSVPDTVFEVTAAVDAEDAPEPGTLTLGSSLNISQGTMELTFASGVRSIMQAPVTLTLLAKDQVYLHEGTAWFHVPPEARGFRVTTPELHITDLGTEFGVLATPEASDEVHVFTGTVKVRSRNPLENELTLTANQARLSDPAGRLKETAPRPGDFLTTLPAELPHLHFSFDHQSGGVLAVDGPHPAAAEIEATLVSPDPASCLVPGVSGKALALDGNGTHLRTNWPGFSGNTPRSVAFWLRIPPGHQQHPILPALVGWGDPDNGLNSRWKITVAQDEEDRPAFPRISFGIERFDGTTALNDGIWHHFVTTYTGKTLDSGLPDVAIHIDGRRESLTRNPGKLAIPGHPVQVRTLTTSFHANPLRIGIDVTDHPYTFHGDLDELSIYQGAISEKTIQALLSKGPRPQAPQSTPQSTR